MDLVLCGHSHNYERSFLLKGHFGNSATFNPIEHVLDASCGNPANGEEYVKYLDGDSANMGTVYCVVGNSGSVTSGKPMNYPAYCNGYQNEYGSLTIDINGNELLAKYFTKDGIVKDEFKIVKQSCLSSVEEKGNFVKTFHVFPNPFDKELQIELQLVKEESISVEVVDLSGKTVATIVSNKKLSGQHQFKWQPAQIAKGNYLVKISNGTNTLTKTVTLQ